ncbi:TIGR03086 family metal-binding protein [Allokutzneria sp. A3M-2-11 16]|uniref:TIGR03086 family metal-binding protein n=1 Tax=Allokutzneria sp. A3M-2-11 16 TaxID=2962043 RepID=UPI0020B64463|nr:TIGR03086 family metal-binding protein [Allokutzneria sp. A3M-2-11 16]MCP3804032.1 TIGR03086 family metal-binding protein [Allokutzneria sp. A3M-2-11 16]
MSDLMARAAAPFLEIVRNIKPDQLGSPTPCAEFDVRALIDHLLHWGPSLEGAARKEAVPPGGASGDWAEALEAQVERTLAAWRPASAWEGMTTMGGSFELPAELVGGMVVGEFVVHGWDLARATGQHVEWDADVVDYVHREIARSADQGREMGVYGPEAPVPTDASTLDKALALSGRSPSWPA